MFSNARFAELMQKDGVSNYKLAKFLECSQSSVKNWLTKTEPSAEYISKIASYFKVSANYLLGLEDRYGLTDSDWATMGLLFKDTRESLGFARDLAADGEVVTVDDLKAFESAGAPLTPDQLTVACGHIGISPTAVFGTWSDKLWPAKKAPTDTDGREMGELEFAAHKYEGKLSEADKATIMKLMQTLAAANEAGGDDGKTD